MRRPALLGLLLIVLTLVAYWPVRHAGFTNFDDELYVTDNAHVLHGLTSDGLKWAFTTFHASNWHPLTWVSHMADVSCFGENAAGSHLVNVGFHLANTLLLLLLLWRMTGAVWRSGFVAALFALHPLHVESVAWVAERKDVLSTWFALLTLLAYARYVMGDGWRTASGGRAKVQAPRPQASGADGGKDEEPRSPSRVAQSSTLNPQPSTSRRLWYTLALLLFALGLLSKPMLVTLPFVMLLLDYWPLGRLQFGARARAASKSTSPELSPMGRGRSQVSIAASGATAFRLSTLNPQLSTLIEKLPFFALSAAACAVTFWAQKTGGAVMPMEELPLLNRLANAAVAYETYLAKAFWPTKLAVVYPFVLVLPGPKVALAVAGLLGASGLAFIARRRAPYVWVGWLWFLGTLVPVIGLVQVGTQAMADRYTYLPLLGVFVIVAWGAADLGAHWRIGPMAVAAGGTLILTGCFICTRMQLRYWQDSLALFSHAVEVTTNNPLAEQNLGYALALSGQEREALRHFDAALRLWPDFRPALVNRGIALMLAGRVDDAIADYREAIRLRPDFARAYYQLGGALAQQKKLAEATTNYLLALRYQPDLAEAHTKLGNLLLLEGDKTNAMAHLYEAVRIRPDYEEGQYALGNELAQQQKFSEAVIHLRAALKAQPKYAPALNDLAWLLATLNDPAIRDVPEAIRLAQRACELTWNKEPRLLATLGVAQSEAGQFAEAIRTTEQALSLAGALNDQKTVTRLRQRLEFYRKGEPYHAIPQ